MYRLFPLPPTPTTALPMTEAKIQVFAARATARVQLFHPNDATVPDTLLSLQEAPEDPEEAFRRFLERLNASS